MGCDCEEFLIAVNNVQKDYPKQVKKYLQKSGNKLKSKTLKKAKNSVGKKTGNLYKSIKRGKVYKFSGNGADSVRVYSSAPHAHLLNNGHRKVSKSGKDIGGFVEGKHFFEKAKTEFESDFISDTQEFVEKAIVGYFE